MSQIDPVQERARLAARYSEMSDLELMKVGRDPAALTEWARGALGEEIKRRGLRWEPPIRVAKPTDELDILMRLGNYENRNTAALVRDFLAEKGIRAFFLEEEPSAFAQSPNAKESGQTQLLLRAQDLGTARSLIAENQKAQLDLQRTEGDGSDPDRPVILRTYRDMPQAFVEKSVLDDVGISCFLQDDNVIRMDWLWSNAIGGIKLMVRQRDAIEAGRILKEVQWDNEKAESEKP